jgi:hypothetical protein
MNTLDRRFIPPGALKVSDKLSDAVAYLYANTAGAPCARVFYGKQSKPVVAYRYRNDAEREASIIAAFKGRQARAAKMAEYAAERKDAANPYKVGDVFRSSWGYDQTNINYYQAIKVTAKTVTVREIAQERITTGAMHGRCAPAVGQFLETSRRGEKICRVGAYGALKINSSERAHFIKPIIGGGVPVYASSDFSETH